MIFWVTGLALKRSGQLEAAVVACKRAIEIDSRNSMAYFNLGNTYQDLRRYTLAIENFQTVLRMDPSHVDALFNLAVAFQDRASMAITPHTKQSDLLNAGKCYQEVYAIRPDITEAKKALDALRIIFDNL